MSKKIKHRARKGRREKKQDRKDGALTSRSYRAQGCFWFT